MIGPKRRLADLKGPLELGAGAGQIPKGTQYGAEVVVPGGHVRVVRPEGGLADPQGPLQFSAGAS
jgi:hypothetical protein